MSRPDCVTSLTRSPWQVGSGKCQARAHGPSFGPWSAAQMAHSSPNSGSPVPILGSGFHFSATPRRSTLDMDEIRSSWTNCAAAQRWTRSSRVVSSLRQSGSPPHAVRASSGRTACPFSSTRREVRSRSFRIQRWSSSASCRHLQRSTAWNYGVHPPGGCDGPPRYGAGRCCIHPLAHRRR
jgi:hypothetical protein